MDKMGNTEQAGVDGSFFPQRLPLSTIFRRHIVSSAVARVVRFSVAGLALGATSTVSIAQNQPEPAVEKAPLGRVITVNDAAGAAQRVFRGEYLYESNGYVVHQPVNHDREFFELTPGQRGQAIFVSGTVTTTVDLEFKLTMLSPTRPGVFYWIFRQANGQRLWAFQTDSTSIYGYGIFVNDSGKPFSIRDWVAHDWSRRSPGW